MDSAPFTANNLRRNAHYFQRDPNRLPGGILSAIEYVGYSFTRLPSNNGSFGFERRYSSIQLVRCLSRIMIWECSAAAFSGFSFRSCASRE